MLADQHTPTQQFKRQQHQQQQHLHESLEQHSQLKKYQNSRNLQDVQNRKHLVVNPAPRFEDDTALTNLSISSSPSSTLSFDFTPVASSATAAAAQDPVLVAGFDSDFEFNQDFDFPMLADNDLMMQSDHWLPPTHISSGRPINHHKIVHHRDSSISSLGSASAGPASPFSQNTSNPHILLNDSLSNDGFSSMSSYYDDHSYPMAKQATSGHDAFYNHGNAAFAPSDSLPMPQGSYGSFLAANRQRAAVPTSHSERGLQPPPDLSISSNRSQPVSVASSIASNSPATPLLDQEDEARRRNGEKRSVASPATSLDADDFFMFDGGEDDADDECSRFFNNIVPFQSAPKFDRTMTDVYNDELYSPSFAMPTSSASAASQLGGPVAQEVFTQRLNQANNQHLSAASHQSPASTAPSRDQSPFRHGSPLAPSQNHDFGAPSASNLRFSSMQLQQQQQQRQQQEQQQQRGMQGTSTPQTISPKDVVLDYREQEGDADSANYSLFAQGNQQPAFSVDQNAPHMGQSYSDMTGASVTSAPNFNYLAPQLGPGMQLPQQYPFIAEQHGLPAVSGTAAATRSTGHMPMPRAVSSLAALSEPVPGSQRPGIVNNDGGTYTCTYHGCTQRFDSPSLLQKHKREGHRQAHALAGARRVESNTMAADNTVNTQAGPHRCERINPSTGKPCNTVFSRPYDLTRHEDTIHNARKQKVRCNLCTEEKTFSRADALTRHFRVCHPEVEFTGKHRKRATHVN